MYPKTDRRDMLVYRGYTEGIWIPNRILYWTEGINPPPPRRYIWPSLHVSIFFLFLSFLCCIILFSAVVSFLFLPLSALSSKYTSRFLPPHHKTRQECNTFIPSEVLKQNTTHHYRHSLFQSGCYVMKTLRAGVVLIPDDSPAQFIKHGQTPLNKYYNTKVFRSDWGCFLTWV